MFTTLFRKLASGLSVGHPAPTYRKPNYTPHTQMISVKHSVTRGRRVNDKRINEAIQQARRDGYELVGMEEVGKHTASWGTRLVIRK